MSDNKPLYRRLAYIAENFDQDDPEDKEMWDEYRAIKEQLGLNRVPRIKEKN